MLTFNNTEIEFLLLCLSTLFTLMNPLGITPIFVVLTERFSIEQRQRIARKGIITGTIILLVFALLGTIIFRLYGITVEAFQIMGGIIFFRSGLKMLEAEVSRTRTTPKEREASQEQDDIAISPIGIPLITGPGAITGVMLLSGKAHSIYSIGTLVLAILLSMAAFYFILRGGDRVSNRIGVTGMRVIQRVMGLILMVIAVQFVINGLVTVLKQFL